jgi:hypothetical protein
MLKKLRGLNWPALAASALFVVIFYGAPCLSSHGGEGHQAKVRTYNANSYDRNAPSKFQGVIKPSTGKRAASAEHETDHGDCLPCLVGKGFEHIFLWWVRTPDGFFAGWVAIFTLALVFVTRAQIQLARQEFMATHRPKFAIRDIYWKRLESGAAVVAYTLSNRGRNSATIEESVVRLTTREHADFRATDTNGANRLGRLHFAPGQYTSLYHEPTGEKERTIVGSNEDLNARAVFTGTIVYSDAVGVRRRFVFRRFCESIGSDFVQYPDPTKSAEYND